jgi:hypothetical protein
MNVGAPGAADERIVRRHLLGDHGSSPPATLSNAFVEIWKGPE